MKVRIVRAMPEQAAQLGQIARTAKAHWGYPARWMEAWHEIFDIRPEVIGADEYLVAHSADGQPVGFCAVCGAPGAAWTLEHLWVLPEWQGKGVGRCLFDAAVAYVREWGGEEFGLRADPNAEGFYLRLGAVRTGEVDATMFGVPRTLPVMRYAIV